MKHGKALKTALLLLVAALLYSCAEAVPEDGSINLSKQKGTVKITEGGVYTLTGKLKDGQILIEAPKEDKVELILSGAEISSRDGAAIECREAKDLILTLAEGTKNTLTDGETEREEASAALFSKADLKIRGEGSLNVEGNYKHGIDTKDDLTIEGGDITVRSVSDALRGKDSVSVEGGSFDLKAGKDGKFPGQREP